MDFLRVLCSLLVLISHLRVFPHTGFTREFLSVGAIGVDFFFILSGWSMAAMFEKHSLKSAWAARFLLNRFIRVCVPYFVALTAYLSVCQKTYPGLEILRSFAFLNNYSSDYSSWGLPVLPPGWSLNYEVLFYVVLLLAGFYQRNISLGPVLLIAVITAVFVPPSYIWLELLMGYYIYCHRDKLKTLKISKPTRYLLVLISCIVIITAREGAGDFISLRRILFWGMPAMLLFVLVFLYRKETSLVDKISKKYNFSFALYLVHWIVLTWYSEYNYASPLILYPALIGATMLFYVCIERPAHHLSKRIVH